MKHFTRLSRAAALVAVVAVTKTISKGGALPQISANDAYDGNVVVTMQSTDAAWKPTATNTAMSSAKRGTFRFKITARDSSANTAETRLTLEVR